MSRAPVRRLELVAMLTEVLWRLGIEPEDQHAVGAVGVVAGTAVKGSAGPQWVLELLSQQHGLMFPVRDALVASKADVHGFLQKQRHFVRRMRGMAGQAFALGNGRVVIQLVGEPRLVVASKAQHGRLRH